MIGDNMTMQLTKVCAHFNLSPFQHSHERFDSAKEAIDYLRQHGDVDRGDGERSSVSIYPQCSQCNSHMNFHDWPWLMYSMGPRGGIKRESC
jgi:hypothetical protein